MRDAVSSYNCGSSGAAAASKGSQCCPQLAQPQTVVRVQFTQHNVQCSSPPLTMVAAHAHPDDAISAALHIATHPLHVTRCCTATRCSACAESTAEATAIRLYTRHAEHAEMHYRGPRWSPTNIVHSCCCALHCCAAQQHSSWTQFPTAAAFLSKLQPCPAKQHSYSSSSIMLLLLLHRSDYCQAAAMPLLLVKGHSRRLTGAASCSCLTPSSAQLRCGKLNLDYSELSALTVGCAPAARLGKHPAALGTAAASYPAGTC